MTQMECIGVNGEAIRIPQGLYGRPNLGGLSINVAANGNRELVYEKDLSAFSTNPAPGSSTFGQMGSYAVVGDGDAEPVLMDGGSIINEVGTDSDTGTYAFGYSDADGVLNFAKGALNIRVSNYS